MRKCLHLAQHGPAQDTHLLGGLLSRSCHLLLGHLCRGGGRGPPQLVHQVSAQQGRQRRGPGGFPHAPACPRAQLRGHCPANVGVQCSPGNPLPPPPPPASFFLGFGCGLMSERGTRPWRTLNRLGGVQRPGPGPAWGCLCRCSLGNAGGPAGETLPQRPELLGTVRKARKPSLPWRPRGRPSPGREGSSWGSG